MQCSSLSSTKCSLKLRLRTRWALTTHVNELQTQLVHIQPSMPAKQHAAYAET